MTINARPRIASAWRSIPWATPPRQITSRAFSATTSASAGGLIKLSPGFQPSTRFTHLHQIKAYDGDAGAPVLTLTARKGSPDMLQLIHCNGTSGDGEC